MTAKAEPPRALAFSQNAKRLAPGAEEKKAPDARRRSLFSGDSTRTEIRLTSERERAAQARSLVAPATYDDSQHSQWRGREESNDGAHLAQAPSPGEFRDPRNLPLNGPATNGEPETTWTPRASGAKLLNEPYSANRADYGPAYRTAQRPADRQSPGEERNPLGRVRSTDPFDDPFGDGVGTAPLTIRAPRYQDDSAKPEPLATDPTQPGPPMPPQAKPAPAANKPCPHVFNGVNCCDEGERCENLKHMLKQKSIRTISLDLTPRFRPGDDKAEESYQKSKRLARAVVRDWRDREGNVVGRGRLVDLRDHRVIIEDENGEEARLVFRRLSDTDHCYVTAFWSLPTECNLGDEVYAGRSFIPMTFTWKASATCHKPLYFEEVQLERYGHTMGPWLQPSFSAAHFFASAVVLPYNMGVHPLNECQYPLGHYRPGDCAPWLLPAVPISARGALMQTGAVLGGIYVLP